MALHVPSQSRRLVYDHVKTVDETEHRVRQQLLNHLQQGRHGDTVLQMRQDSHLSLPSSPCAHGGHAVTVEVGGAVSAAL